jgi:hypothetical protein
MKFGKFMKDLFSKPVVLVAEEKPIVKLDDVIKENKIPLKVPEDDCQPDSCFGECGGGGDCEIAEEWQERIHPPMIIRKSDIRKAVLMEKKKKKKNKKKKKHKKKLKKK